MVGRDKLNPAQADRLADLTSIGSPVGAHAWREADWFGGIVEAVLSARAVPLPENTVPSAGRAPQTGEAASRDGEYIGVQAMTALSGAVAAIDGCPTAYPCMKAGKHGISAQLAIFGHRVVTHMPSSRPTHPKGEGQ